MNPSEFTSVAVDSNANVYISVYTMGDLDATSTHGTVVARLAPGTGYARPYSYAGRPPD